MPTTKHRINLSVPAHLDRMLSRLADRDDLSVGSKALELLTRAIELEEDETLLAVVSKRERTSAAFVSHTKAWK